MGSFNLGNALADALGEVPAQNGGRTPEAVGAEVRSLTNAAKRMTLWFGVEIGRRLTEAKALVGHGCWLDWLKKETEFSERTASRFILLFTEYGTNREVFPADNPNSPTLANLSVSNALALLAVPEEDRAGFAGEVSAERLSVRELREAIRQRDEALRRAEEAKRDAAALEAERDTEREKAAKLENDLALSGNLLAAAKLDASVNADSLREALKEKERLQEQIRELENRPAVEVHPDLEAAEKLRKELQARIDAAEREAKKSAERLKAAEQRIKAAEDEKEKAGEELAKARERLQAAGAEKTATVISGSGELSKFELLYDQAVQYANVMHGLFLKVRNSGEADTAEKLRLALCALSDKIREAAT